MPFKSHWDIKRDMPDLTGKVAIVTGGNTGLGKETVRYLALNNAKVYMASRTESRALSAIEELKKEHPELSKKAGIAFLPLNLASFESVISSARIYLEKEERLDLLINNAGIMSSPYELTADGFEAQFQSNHLGHFLFTLQLLPLLIKTSKDPGSSVRIVQLSSDSHDHPGSSVKFDSVESINRELGGPIPRYGHSKLANILFIKELSRRLSNERIFCVSLNPGPAATEISRGVMESYPKLKPFISLASFILNYSPYQAATTTLYAATSSDIEKNDWKGEYFVPFAKLGKPSKLAQDLQLASNLWKLSEEIIKDKTGFVYEW